MAVLTVESSPMRVKVKERFNVQLWTNQTRQEGQSLEVRRIVVLEDPDENEYNMPLNGPIVVQADSHNSFFFENLRFEKGGEGRLWPIKFRLELAGKKVVSTTLEIEVEDA